MGSSSIYCISLKETGLCIFSVVFSAHAFSYNYYRVTSLSLYILSQVYKNDGTSKY